MASVPYCVLLFCSQVNGFALGWFEFGYGPKNMFLLRHGMYFAAGMYFWLLNRQGRLAPLDRLLLALALLAAGLEMFARAAQIAPSYAVGAQGPIGLPLLVGGALALFALLASLIYLSLRHAAAWIPRPALARWVRILGLVTYPYYLIHEILGGAILHAARGQGLAPAAGLALAMAGIALVAILIARYGEPLLRRAIGVAFGWDRGEAHGLKQAGQGALQAMKWRY